MKKLFVGGIPPAVHEHSLTKYFENFGPVIRVEIPSHKESGIRKGYAFVTFKTLQGSEHALSLQRHFIEDHEISVKPALKPQVACAQTKDLQTRKIYAFNFNKETTPRTVLSEFGKFGPVHSFLNPKGGLKKRGFCYVIMQEKQGFNALTHIGSLWIDGALVQVQAATPLKEVTSHYMNQYQPQVMRNKVSKTNPLYLFFSSSNVIRALNEHPNNYTFRRNPNPVQYKTLPLECPARSERRHNPLLRVADQLSAGRSSTGQSGQNSRGRNSRDSSNRGGNRDSIKPEPRRYSLFRSSNSREFEGDEPAKRYKKSKFDSGAPEQKGADQDKEEENQSNPFSNNSHEESN